jgi:GntR family transcriptional regulator
MTGGTAMADPMYRVISDELRQEIESGQLAPGSQLPTELELRDRFNASRNTIRDAVKTLVNLGLVVTRPGQGTFVTAQIDPFVTTLSADADTGFGGGEGATYLSEVSRAHRKPSMSEPRVEIQLATGEIAHRLRVEEGTQLISRHQSRTIDNTPWSLQTSFYPMEFVLKGATRLLEASNISQGTVQYIQETLGLEQTGYRDWITVRAPDANEITFFRIPGDGRVPVFEIFRTAFDQSGDPMRVTVSVFPADRNQFIVNVGDPPNPQLGTN